MDAIERLLAKITRGLVKAGALIKTASGYIIDFAVTAIINSVRSFLIDLLMYGAKRIINAIRERSSEEGIPGVIYREIVAMASESFDLVVEAVRAVTGYLEMLYNRGVEFMKKLGQRSLDSLSWFSDINQLLQISD